MPSIASRPARRPGCLQILDPGPNFIRPALRGSQGCRAHSGKLAIDHPQPWVGCQPFAEALTKLKKGEYTKTPVKTDFGYHVIQLEDSRPLTPPTYEQVKPQLQQRAQQQQVEQLVKKLRENAKVN